MKEIKEKSSVLFVNFTNVYNRLTSHNGKKIFDWILKIIELLKN